MRPSAEGRSEIVMPLLSKDALALDTFAFEHHISAVAKSEIHGLPLVARCRSNDAAIYLRRIALQIRQMDPEDKILGCVLHDLALSVAVSKQAFSAEVQ